MNIPENPPPSNERDYEPAPPTGQLSGGSHEPAPPTGPLSGGSRDPAPPNGARWQPPAGMNPYWQPPAATNPYWQPPASTLYDEPGRTAGDPWAAYARAPQPPYQGHPPAPAAPPKARHRLRNGLLLAALLAGFAGGGAAIGRLSADSSRTSAAARSGASSGGSSLSPGSSGSGGSFGIGGFGGFGGLGGSSGSSSSTGSGASTGVGAGGGSINASTVAARVDPALVDVNVVLGYEEASAAGTGIVLTSNGEVLTNNHVVNGATSIRVTDVGNGRTYSAKVVGTDPTKDIAVIQLQNASGLTTARIGSSSSIHTGQPVLAIGNAGGVGGTPSTAAGAVVALHQSITATDDSGADSEHLSGLIETDAPIQPGDSGGPLVNKSGQVLAIDTAASSSSQFQSTSSNQSQAYAIPISTALRIASQIESGQGSSTIHIGTAAMLGVEVEASAAGAGSSGSGAVIAAAIPGMPAAAAGLGAGDVIVSLNGHAVTSPSGLSSLMNSQHPGDRVTVGFDDPSGQYHTVTVTLAAGPPA
jgi:S1-C subfamily serine protease